MLYEIPIPRMLDRTTRETALPRTRANLLQRIDLHTWRGRVRPGLGISRATGHPVFGSGGAGSASRIIGTNVLERRDCRNVVVEQSAAGEVNATVGSPTGLNPPCFGILPQTANAPQDDNGKAIITAAPSSCNGASILPPVAGPSCDPDCLTYIGNVIAVACAACPSGYVLGLVYDAFCNGGDECERDYTVVECVL